MELEILNDYIETRVFIVSSPLDEKDARSE